MTDSGASQSTAIKILGKSPKKITERFPWPRLSDLDENGKIVPLGVDVVAKEKDIIKIIHKFFKVKDVSMDELLQDVFVAIIHKNYSRSAHDPRKSSFGHYIFMIGNHVCISLVHKKKRYERESESLDEPTSSSDDRTILDKICVETTFNPMNDHYEAIEKILRRGGNWECARYIRAVRSGASPEIVRETLSWCGRNVSSKTIRDIRGQIQDFIRENSPELV